MKRDGIWLVVCVLFCQVTACTTVSLRFEPVERRTHYSGTWKGDWKHDEYVVSDDEGRRRFLWVDRYSDNRLMVRSFENSIFLGIWNLGSEKSTTDELPIVGTWVIDEGTWDPPPVTSSKKTLIFSRDGTWSFDIVTTQNRFTPNGMPAPF